MRKFLLLGAILVFVYWRFLTPGARVANDYPYIFPNMGQASFNFPQLWSLRTAEGLGEYTISTLWAWPVDFVYGLGAKLGLGFEALERVFGILPFLALGIWGIRRFLGRFGISGWPSVAASLFYLANSYILLLIDGGQLSIALAYAWFPTAYISFEESINGNFKRRIIAGLAVSVLGFFDIRFIYLLGIILFIRFVYEFAFLKRKDISEWIFKWVKSAGITLLIFVGLNAYWIVPLVVAKSFTLPIALQKARDASAFSFTNLGHSLFLLQPHWYKNVFGKVTELRPEFVLIPALAFLAGILKRNSKDIGFWLVIAVFGVFLTKGTNPPFGEVYTFLSGNIPGFSIFRDSSKFYFLTTLSYSVLIGTVTYELAKRFKGKFFLVSLFLILYFIFLAFPAYSGKMTGIFSEPRNKDQFFSLAEEVQKDSTFGRILWVQSKPPLGFSSPIHPTLEALRLLNFGPFAAAVRGTYETTNFLRAPHIGQVLDIAGVSYISYPFPDTKREDLKQDNIDYYQWFVNKLSGYSWVEKVMDFGSVQSLLPLIKTKSHQDKFFVAENAWYVIGSDDVYSNLNKISDFRLSDNALIFGENNPDGLLNTDFSNSTQFTGTILNHKSLLDFWASLSSPEYFVFPAEALDYSPNRSGWWKREGTDIISWRGFLQDKYSLDNSDFDYGGGWAIGEGNVKLPISNDNFKKDHILLVRAMVSSKGGTISFYQNGNLIGLINTKSENPEKVVWEEAGLETKTFDKANFLWFEVGSLVSDGPVEIRSEGNINVLNALISIPLKTWMDIRKVPLYGQEIDLSNTQAPNLDEKFSVQNQVEVNYEEISPTEYKVDVSGVDPKRPSLLVFSTTYNPFWKMEGQESLSVYGFLNGFFISSDGEYRVYFEPQKYVLPGLLISIVFLSSTLLFLILKK